MLEIISISNGDNHLSRLVLKMYTLINKLFCVSSGTSKTTPKEPRCSIAEEITGSRLLLVILGGRHTFNLLLNPLIGKSRIIKAF